MNEMSETSGVKEVRKIREKLLRDICNEILSEYKGWQKIGETVKRITDKYKVELFMDLSCEQLASALNDIKRWHKTGYLDDTPKGVVCQYNNYFRKNRRVNRCG